MSGGVGFARNAQEVSKSSRSLMGDRNSYAGGRQSFPKHVNKLHFKKADPESLKALSLQMQKEKRAERIKWAIGFLIIAAITLWIIF